MTTKATATTTTAMTMSSSQNIFSQSKGNVAPKSRVIKVPSGCSPDDLKKLLASQLGPGVKIQVKNKLESQTGISDERDGQKMAGETQAGKTNNGRNSDKTSDGGSIKDKTNEKSRDDKTNDADGKLKSPKDAAEILNSSSTSPRDAAEPDESVEITKVVKSSGAKPPFAAKTLFAAKNGDKTREKGKKKQLQLPVDRILMIPKNHRYLHPR